MRRYALRDDQWDRIKDFLPGCEGHVGGTAADICPVPCDEASVFEIGANETAHFQSRDGITDQDRLRERDILEIGRQRSMRRQCLEFSERWHS